MKLTVTKEQLFQCLQRMIAVVPAKTTLPVLTNILFELEGNRLRLTGTDLEVSILTSLDVIGEVDGSAAFPAKRMFDLIRELPDLPLRLETDSSHRLTIKTEKGNYRVAGQSADEYPHISTEEQIYSVNYSAARLLSFIEKTLFAVSTDEMRTTLMGVLLETRPNELRLVATDGHRLVKIRDLEYSHGQEPVQVIVPVKGLQLLSRNAEQDGDLKISISRDHITFHLGDTTIHSKVISGQYPMYEKVIPTQNDQMLTVDRDLLSSMIRRANIFSSQHSHQIKWSLEPKSLTVIAEDVEVGGNSKESIEVEYEGAKMDIGYNASYLLEILRHVDTERVVFKLKDAGSAAIIEPTPQKEGLEVTLLLMPIRLNE